MDTFIPSWKVFVFSRTSHEQGPFHYVVGSHRNTEGRLRWLFERSRALVNASRCASLPRDDEGHSRQSTYNPARG